MRAAGTQILHDEGEAGAASWDQIGLARRGPVGIHDYVEGFTMPIHSAFGQPTESIGPTQEVTIG